MILYRTTLTMAPFDPVRIPIEGHEPSSVPQIFALSMAPALWRADAEFHWLSEQELRRVHAMASAKRRAQFVAGRWLLRHAARSIFGSDAILSVSETPQRGPGLALENRPGAPVVSLSHSAEMVICGVARSWALGVDVEAIRPRSDWEGLAAFTLHPHERSRIDGLRGAERWRQFFCVWTLKEALGKALGIGLALPFNRIKISRDGGIVEAPEECGLDEREWRFATLDPGAGMVGAVAWCGD